MHNYASYIMSHYAKIYALKMAKIVLIFYIINDNIRTTMSIYQLKQLQPFFAKNPINDEVNA